MMRTSVCVSVCVSVTVDCGETAERIEMPLGMEVDVGPVTKNKKGFPDPPREGENRPQNFACTGCLAALLDCFTGGAAASKRCAFSNKLPSGQLSPRSAEFLFTYNPGQHRIVYKTV